MDNILNFPKETIVSRVVPKTMFYRFMEVNPRMKTRFVNDVVSITWLYKLAPDTLNVTDTEDMKEVEVFVAILKQPDCPPDLFAFIDANMPHHIVFVLLHESNAMLLVNYKEWADNTHTKFRITQTFTSHWVNVSELSLKIEGQSLPRIYDNFVARVSGIGEHKAGKLSEIVQLKKEIAKAESDLQALQKKMRKEPQLDRQMLMNKEVKTKRAEVEEMKRKLVELK